MGSRGQNRETGNHRYANGFRNRLLPDENVGQSRTLRLIEHLVNPRSSQIAVDQKHTMTLLRESDREVRGGKTFPFGWSWACDHKSTQPMHSCREQKIRAQSP